MEILSKILSPDDLKSLSIADLNQLCAEIRSFLIGSISKTGGHLASNLGVVELTIALHTVFDTPTDKIIWDVGHQSYVHKVLTGRRPLFHTLRRRDGLSGFPKDIESSFDAFNTGHASTSISAALGYCLARDLQEQDYHVTAVIGDGAMTGGLAYEAINNAGRANSDLLVILNDNQMSISENVGALSRYLSEIRTAPAYLGAKEDVSEFLNKAPLLGDPLARLIERVKDGIKYLLIPGAMFEELGFNYIGPINGHNLNDLLSVLRKVKRMTGAVLLHVYTTKGKGYEQAEESPTIFHGVDCFDVATGAPVKSKQTNTYSDIFGKTVLELADDNEKIVAITAAMPSGVGLCEFQQKYPYRMFDVGIAEGHAVTFAAGLAKGGLIPVFAVYSSFLQRAYDQIVHDVCIQNLHVVFAIDRAGIVGADGETHQGIYDIAYLSHIPNMTILSPKNKREFIQMLSYAVRFSGPIAIRYPKGIATEVYKEYSADIVHGRMELIREGEELILLAVGSMMDTAAEVVTRLRKDGISPGLVNVRFIKPIDVDMVQKLARYRAVYVLEEHTAAGGFGAKLLEEMSLAHVRVHQFHRFALPNAFIEHGGRDEILAKYGLNAQSIVTKILDDRRTLFGD